MSVASLVAVISSLILFTCAVVYKCTRTTSIVVSLVANSDWYCPIGFNPASQAAFIGGSVSRESTALETSNSGIAFIVTQFPKHKASNLPLCEYPEFPTDITSHM